MKLYTICDKKDSEVKLNSTNGLKKQEYSYDEYLVFLKQSENYYIYLYHSWYETDMSDSSSGSNSDSFSINYNNMIIKDNKLYGVLVKTTTSFPKYEIYVLGKESHSIDLEGGYNSNVFTWYYKTNDLTNQLTLKASQKYIIIKEQIYYQNDKVSLYLREIINLLQNDFIIKNNDIVEVNYNNKKFILSDKKTLKIKEGVNVYTLIAIDEQFLNDEIYDVTYDDYHNGNYSILK